MVGAVRPLDHPAFTETVPQYDSAARDYVADHAAGDQRYAIWLRVLDYHLRRRSLGGVASCTDVFLTSRYKFALY